MYDAGSVIGRLVVDGRGVDASEALDHALLGGRSEEHAAPVPVRGLDHQGVAFPVAARRSAPEPDAVVERRPAIERNDAGLVHHLALDRDVVLGLEDLMVVEVERVGSDQPAGQQAAIVHRPVFVGVDGNGSDQPAELLGAARPSFGREWNLAVRRVDDERRAAAANDLAHLHVGFVELAAGLDLGLERSERALDSGSRRSPRPLPRSGTPCREPVSGRSSGVSVALLQMP